MRIFVDSSSGSGRDRPRWPLIAAPVVMVLVALGALGARQLLFTPAAVPVLLPVYEIEAESNRHKTIIPLLNMGQPGAPVAPMPVDVDGDLIPDVTVAVNLTNVEGLFQDPLVLDGAVMAGRVLAPNIQIDRLLPGVPVSTVLARPSHPLKIAVKMTVKDAEGTQPDTVFRFGYDTTSDGAIPATFKGVVNGFNNFFNPLEAVVDTKGGFFGVNSVPTYYEGPLSLIAGLEQGSFKADAKLAYAPFPDSVRVMYSSDDEGQHLAYAHAVGTEVDPDATTHDASTGTDTPLVPGDIPEVDLTTELDVSDGGDVLDLTARIARLPRSINVDYLTNGDAGRIDYRAKADGRLPDVDIDLKSLSSGETTDAAVSVEALPPEVHALWNLAKGTTAALVTTADPGAGLLGTGSGGRHLPCPLPPKARQKGKADPPPCHRPPPPDPDTDPGTNLPIGPGIGAVEARITNFKTEDQEIADFVPTEQQFFNFQSDTVSVNGAAQNQRIISGRVERIRRVQFTEKPDGFDVASRIGDGALPLELHAATDALPDGDRLDATATVAPLPHSIDVEMRSGEKDDLSNPFRLTYRSSQTTDVDANVEVRKPDAAKAACGFPGTTCAEIDVRHLPPFLEARIGEAGDGPGAETRIEIDGTPATGSTKPDVTVNAILGKTDATTPDPNVPASEPVPLVVHGELLGIPDHVRVRTLEGADETLENLDFLSCEITDLDAGTCEPGTEGEVTRANFKVANFLPKDRPADLPHPSATAPNFANIVVRGLEKTIDTVRFEAAGRMEHIAQTRYVKTEGLFGVHTDAGGGKDLQAVIDIRNVDQQDDQPDNKRTDIVGDALVSPLPRTLDLCLRESSHALTLASPVPFTDRCENPDPFADGSTSKSPLTFAYGAASSFDARGGFEITTHGDPTKISDEHSSAIRFGLTNVPAQITAHVQAPPQGTQGKVRVLALAPGASNFDATLTAEDRRGGADCDDPRPAGNVQCLKAEIDDLPPRLSAVADPAPGAAQVEVHACDWDFRAASRGCRGPEVPVGSVEVAFRSRNGKPAALPVPPEPSHPQYLVFQAATTSDDDTELVAQGRIERVRHVTFNQEGDGFDAFTDLGDNVKDLEAHVYLDSRPDPDGGTIKASSLITPLPQTIHISQHGPGANQETDPLVVSYDSSARVKVVAEAEIRDTVSGPRCGDRGTLCARVEVVDIPRHLTARVGEVVGPIAADSTRQDDVAFDLDLDRAAASDPKPDVILDATIGSEDDTPLIAHTVMTDAPDHARVRMNSREKVANVGSTLDTVESDLQSLAFFACDRDFGAGTCRPDPDEPSGGRVGALEVAIRNFHLRPTDFPPPPVFATPLHASVTQRPGDKMEAALTITDIAEVQYLKRGAVSGVSVVAGGGKDLAAHIDLKGVSLGSQVGLGDLKVDNPVFNLTADTLVQPLPASLGFCFRQGGISPLGPAAGAWFTAPCDDSTPFNDNTTPEHTPMSVAYQASSTFNVTTDADVVITGTNHETGTAIPQHRVRGHVETTNLPENLTFHLLQPAKTKVATVSDGVQLQEQGPMRAFIDAPNAPLAGPTIVFAGDYLVGDETICQDPRPSVEAFCVKGTLANIPTQADFFFDPDRTADNLRVTTGGTGDTDLTGLELSSVKPARDEITKAVIPGKSEVLIITGSLEDLPKPLVITGDLDLPDSPDDPPAVEFLVQNGKTLGRLDAVVKNFIAPDPTAHVVVPARPVGAAPDQDIRFIQRGEAFKLDADIRGVKGAAFRTVRYQKPDGSFASIGTHEAKISFGANQNIRAFVDLQADAITRVIADALLENVPAGLTLCFRGPREGAQVGKTAVSPTFCDNRTAVEDHEGAIELLGRPEGNPGMDVDAFIRVLSGGGTSLLAARANIENIPPVVRGTLPAAGKGELDISAYDQNNNETGIEQINFQAATFDLAAGDTGYGATLPYTPRPAPNAYPFTLGAPPPAAQHLQALFSGNNFRIRGQLGLGASPSSHLQRLFMGDSPCAKPSRPGAGTRDDYPAFPLDATKSSYTCVGGAFQSDAGDPLKIQVVKVDDGKVLRLDEAGLTDVPAWFQATIADSEVFTDRSATQQWRRPCGAAKDEGASNGAGADCMPPLIRFDQPSTTSRLFGVLEVGTQAQLALLHPSCSGPACVTPALPLANLNALPESGWSDWADGGSDPKGVRAKIATFGSDTESKADDGNAVRAAVRLAVPESLTVDQIQSYDNDKEYVKNIDQHGDKGKKAKDLRLHYAVRGANGVPAENMGELAGVVHDVAKREQILLSKPCATRVVLANGPAERPANCADYTRGLAIPGELGIQLYTRQTIKDIEVDGEDTRRDAQFFHVDGRSSAPLNAGVRMVSANGPSTLGPGGIGVIDLAVRNTAYGIENGGDPANPLYPSFRLRAEVVSDKGIEPPSGWGEIGLESKNVRINSVFADLDFGPNGAASAARRLDAVVHLRGTKVGADIAGFNSVHGEGVAPVSASAAVDIDPLDLDVKGVLQIPLDRLNDIVYKALQDCCGTVIATIVDIIIGPVLDLIDAILDEILRHFPLRVSLESEVLAQFQLDKVNRFKLRSNILHIKAENTGGTGVIGPINLDVDNFYGGLNFEHTVDIPSPLDWAPGIPDEFTIRIPLLGIQYIPGLLAGLDPTFGLNVAMQYRNCDSFLGQINFITSYANAIEVNGSRDVIAYPLGDPRFQPFGVIPAVLGIFTGPGGYLGLSAAVNIFGGPIFCAAFGIDELYLGISTGADYHPGAGDPFASHPVPMQPGNPPVLPAAPPAADPLPTLTPIVAAPVVVPPNDPPPAPAPLFQGPNFTTTGPLSLCGVHEFSALTVNHAITVTNTPSSAKPFGAGTADACTAAGAGTLELRANNLVINSAGSVVADALISTPVSHVDADTVAGTPAVDPPTGFSGGGHGGRGGQAKVVPTDPPVGSAGVGGTARASTTEGPNTNAGSPGSGPAAGNGGGAIVLVADDQLSVHGTVRANGGAGGGSTGGTCDTDPDDGPAGDQLHVLNIADPPYELAGASAGSGGGSGGGIVFNATRIDIQNANIQAIGGAGGPGKAGVGGAGGGGLIKLVGPIQQGTATALNAGAGTSDFSVLCPGGQPAAPTAPGSIAPVRVQRPASKLLAFPKFWYAGDPVQAIEAYVLGAAKDANDPAKGVSLVTCAISRQISAATEEQAAAGVIANPDGSATPLFPMPPNAPTPSAPCGSGGSYPPQKLSQTPQRMFDDEFEPPDTDSKISITPPSGNAYLGLYTVALRPNTAGNDCLVANDLLQAAFDAADCVVEPLPGFVDRVIGIDGQKPTIAITSPTSSSPPFTSRFVQLVLSGGEQGPSGLARRECRTTGQVDWAECQLSNPSFELKGGDGNNTIEARAFDNAGNVSDVDSITVKLDQGVPEATAHINAPDGQNGWHVTKPVIRIDSFVDGGGSSGPDPLHPFVYKFDNGTETNCPSGPVCTVDPAVVALLEPGPHQFRFTAVDAAGNRYHDSDDPRQATPMRRPSPAQPHDFQYDPKIPQVVISTVPAQPNRTFAGQQWFDTRPYLAFSAIDQVGASGVDRIEYDLSGDAFGFLTYNPSSPPRLGNGITTVCFRAFDRAGNKHEPPCQVYRVDDLSPSASMTVTPSAPNGANGWYTSVPAVSFGSYSDAAGVGASAGHFRYRVDNDGFTVCDLGCAVPAPNLGTGQHLVHFTATDRFGNRTTEQTEELKVDVDRPSTDIIVSPEDANGANGWYLKRPWVVLDAHDQADGSGIATVQYSTNGGATFQPYTAPFRLAGAGQHTVCARSTDVAGNVEQAGNCDVVRIDTADPTAAVARPPMPSSGWYLTTVGVLAAATDPVPGSGVNAAFDSVVDLCSHRPPVPDPATPSGVCISIDGAEFRASTGQLTIPEGVHTVRSFSVDVSGRRSPMAVDVVRVDLSDPVTTARTFPPRPARNDWFRAKPRVVLRATDGDQNAGLSSISYDTGSASGTYTGPLVVSTEGPSTVGYRASDRAQRTELLRTLELKVDVAPPKPVPTGPVPQVWVQLLSGFLTTPFTPPEATLGWTVSDARSPSARVVVNVFDELGHAVRRIDAGEKTLTFNPVTMRYEGAGSVSWDGKDESLTGFVGSGIYHYRVTATDEAGNRAQSAESAPLQIVIGEPDTSSTDLSSL